MKLTNINNYINHIVFVVDASGSMGHLSNDVVKVFDSQIEYLAKRSKELDQETRVTVYLFNNNTKCIIFDKDVLRLPSLASFYDANGGTELVGATLTALEDLGNTHQKYGDHSFLLFTLTDGQHNGTGSVSQLSNKIKTLPDNWTLAVLVPNSVCVHEAKKFGFDKDNIQVWSTDKNGINEVGNTLKEVTNTYMTNRAKGIRGSKNLFNLNTNISKSAVKNNLQQLDSNSYHFIPITDTGGIIKDGVRKIYLKQFVEAWNITFCKGANYYQLTKPEKVQGNKQICIREKFSGKVFSGLNARNMLGLPNHEVKVSPADFGDFEIFIQSNSDNRLLIPGTNLIVIK